MYVAMWDHAYKSCLCCQVLDTVTCFLSSIPSCVRGVDAVDISINEYQKAFRLKQLMNLKFNGAHSNAVSYFEEIWNQTNQSMQKFVINH